MDIVLCQTTNCVNQCPAPVTNWVVSSAQALLCLHLVQGTAGAELEQPEVECVCGMFERFSVSDLDTHTHSYSHRSTCTLC